MCRNEITFGPFEFDQFNMLTLYGIPNCDIIKKATTWLIANNLPFEFHNYKTLGIEADRLKSWFGQVGMDKIFNKRSTTWKELSPEIQASVTSIETVIPVLQQHTSIIKRPVLEKDGKVFCVGFDESEYMRLTS